MSLQLFDFELVAVLSRFPLGLGDQDRAIERRCLLQLREFVEHLELRLGRVQILVRLLDGKPIGLQLVLVDVTLRSQLLAVREVLLRPIEILLGDEHFAFDRLPVLQVRAL